MEFSMTETQKKIVNHIDGALLVTAGPGSGKTRVLTERIINLLNQNKKRILALTFSNKAAEEIKERIEKKIDEDLQEKVYIGTIHSFCLDVVLNRGNLIGLPSGLVIFEAEADKISILKKVFIEMPGLRDQFIEFSNDKNILKNCLKLISEYKQGFILPEVLLDSNDEKDKVFAKLYEAYNNMMLSQKALDFDDILLYAYKIFTERPQIALSYTRLYKYIFVDEAQDLNTAQYKIIKALCNDFVNIMMVGDPAQSIYGFNGSESEYMTRYFREDFSPTEYELVENFRSTKKIIEAAKKIQSNTNSSAVYPLEGELSIEEFADEHSEAEWVVKQIEKLMENGSEWIEGNLSFEMISIIARNRYVLTKVSEQLEIKKIPFNSGLSSRSVESESVAIKIFEAGIRIIINPFDNVHFSQIINLLEYNGDIVDVSDTYNYMDMMLKINESKVKEDYLDYLSTIKKSWAILINNDENFTKAIDILSKELVESMVTNSFEETVENEQYFIQRDIEMWKTNWKNYCKQSVAGQRSLAHFRNQVSLGKTHANNASGISLLTVHMSKGLEFDVVFLIGLNEGTFPDYRAKGVKESQEELNNMFVALTRAKRICYLCYPKKKMMPWGDMKLQRPSRFIDIIRGI